MTIRAAVERYRFCKVFVSADEVDALKRLLAALFDGRFERHSMVLAGMAVDVRRNPDAGEDADSGADFVRWPVIVELEALDQAGEEAMTATTEKALRALWDSGYGAVAACDFEDELPSRGVPA